MAENNNDDMRGLASAEPEVREEVARKGGEETKHRHGREFYEEIGRKGGDARAEEEGPEGMSELGKKGADARSEQAEEETENQ